MPIYSLIIPVFNRPEDIDQVLLDLSNQTFTDFEVLVIESGSTIKAESVVLAYSDKLSIRYFYKSNEGQGYSRNYGMARAKGDFFIILDSDLILPNTYMEEVHNGVTNEALDAFGGPDRAHSSFSPIQKAVDVAMTSFWTTGGMRGRKDAKVPYYPRSFNMGFSRQVYDQIGGFNLPYFGEDLELSHRIIQAGFKVGYLDQAFVYHKRKASFNGFAKQLHFFGRARIQLSHLIPGSLKFVHFIPTIFTLFLVILVASIVVVPLLFKLGILGLILYLLLIFIDAYKRYRSTSVAVLSLAAVFVQMTAYGSGLIRQYCTHTLTRKGAERFKPQKDL